MVEIIAYQNSYQPDFYSLNEIWLDKYGLKEPHDLQLLNDPEGMIINTGGFIWLAKAGTAIVGTAGIMKEANGVFELVKMTVHDAWKGKGIGKLLIEACIEKAKEYGAVKLCLFSNSQLKTAIGLYEKYGFKQVAVTGSPFETADVKMERVL